MRRERSGLGPDWHVGGELAARYAAGTAAESEAWSLEKHVEACGACAAVVSSAVRAGPETGPLLAGIRAAVLERAVQEPRESVGARAYANNGTGPAIGTTVTGAGTSTTTVTGAGTTGVPPRLSRAARVVWAAGPALRGAWLVALVVVALGAVALSYGAGLGASVRPLLLVTAPVLPLAGVALSYGLHADPLYEIATSTPAGGLRLLLTRAAAVLAVSVPALTLAGAALMAGASPYFAGPAVQSGWAAGAVACALLLAARRRSFDHLETP
ncbi:zf-HC2 domain-containing protein [Streptomyces cyaneofuscatus]